MDIEAKSPRAAAKQALAIHRDPTSIATVFEVAYMYSTKIRGAQSYRRDKIDLTPGA
jgi:hypothetical protein